MEELHASLLKRYNIDAKISEKADKFKDEEIKQLIQLFSKAYQDSKYAVVSQLPLELAVIEFCSTQESVMSSLQQDEKTASSVVSVAKKTSPTIDDLRKKERTLKVRSVLDGNSLDASKDKSKEEKKKEESVKHQPELPPEGDSQIQLMENLIYKIKPLNHSLAGVLRGCDIVSYANGQIIFETAYKFHKERLDEGKAKDILENAIREITGKQVRVMVELKQ